MARKTARAPLEHSVLKCQVRLAAAKVGIRIRVMTAPGTPPFTGVRIWPDDNDNSRELELKGGTRAMVNLKVDPQEDFWLEVAYGTGKRNMVQVKYEHRKPFGYKATEVSNLAKVEMVGSVPRIRKD